MIEPRYTNVRRVLDQLNLHPLLRDLTFEQVVAYTVDFMRLVACPLMFIEKVEDLHVHDYRALLPCDVHKINQVRSLHYDRAYRKTTDSFHYGREEENKKDNKRWKGAPHRNPGEFLDKDLTYKVQGQVLYSSVEEDDIQISYQAFSLDEDGFPLIPENTQFLRGLEAYIKMKWFTILFDLTKISQNVLQNAQQEYAWAVGAAQAEFNRLDLDDMQALANSLNTMLLRMTEHRRGFRENGDMEILRQH